MNDTLIAQIYRQAAFLKYHLIYLAYAGSRSYGTATEDSDVDLRGVAFAPKEAIFGLERYEQTILPEPDTVIYSLNKYVKLALKGNPNILELLFVEREQLLICDSWGEQLRSNRQLFLSKKVYQSFGGYAIGNIRKLTQQRSKQADRTIPYDTKDASHLIRLLQMGIQLLQTGTLQVKRENADELLAIKRGEWELPALLAYAEQLFADLGQAFALSSLPEQPDYQAVQQLVIEMNEAFYRER